MSYSNNIKKFATGSLSTFMALGLWASTTSAVNADGTEVTAELMLSIDISGSVDSNEYELQMDGYAAAFEDDEVIEQIENMPDGLAVSVQFWSSEPAPALSWRVLKDEDDAEEFAEYLENLSRPASDTTSVWGYDIGSGTNITGAIAAARSALLNNQYIGNSMVIDVSGDGRSNGDQYYGPNWGDWAGDCGGGSGNSSCLGVTQARNIAVNSGITINGLPIEANNSSTEITTYYDAHVKGGTTGFTETASSFSDFTRAATAKIYQEIDNAVDEAARKPNAQADVITTNEDTAATYNLIAGDTNNSNAGQDTDPNGETLTVTQFVVGTTEYTPGTQNVTLPSGASLTVDSAGNVTYDPNGLFESMDVGESLASPDKFTYTVQNNSGYMSSATATLDINGAADNPIAVNDSRNTNIDSIKWIPVLKNDSDPNTDREELTITQINGISVSVDNVITLNSGATLELKQIGDKSKHKTHGMYTLKYNPNGIQSLDVLDIAGESIETFTYTVSDPERNTDQAKVNVTVNPIDNPDPDPDPDPDPTPSTFAD